MRSEALARCSAGEEGTAGGSISLRIFQKKSAAICRCALHPDEDASGHGMPKIVSAKRLRWTDAVVLEDHPTLQIEGGITAGRVLQNEPDGGQALGRDPGCPPDLVNTKARIRIIEGAAGERQGGKDTEQCMARHRRGSLPCLPTTR